MHNCNIRCSLKRVQYVVPGFWNKDMENNENNLLSNNDFTEADCS